MAKNQMKINHLKFSFRTLLLGVSGIAALIIFIFQCSKLEQLNSINSESNSAWLILWYIPLVFGILCLITAFFNHKNNNKIKLCLDRLSKARRIVVTGCLAFFIVVIYLMRLFVSPTIEIINLGMSGIGLLLYSLALIFCLFALFRKDEAQPLQKDRFFVISLTVILIAWLVMAITKFGLEPDLAFWNVAGVPSIWIGVATIMLVIILLDMLRLHWQKKKAFNLSPKAKLIIEIAIIVFILLSASLIWIKSPYSNSYFITEPIPPDGHHWPKSDARLMDLGGQYLIIGGKLETPYFTEKPFYALFLGLLHYAFGQSYQTITNIQIMFLAFIPVMLYLLGKELLDRWLGISLAAFAIVKEVIALYSTYKISVSNSRLLMTEMPSALLLLILAYILIKWMKSDDRRYAFGLLAGIVIGVGFYIRTNFIVVFLIILAYLFITSLKNIRQRLPQIGFLIIGVVIVTLPWLIYNQVTYHKDPLTWKVQAALNTRFSAFENNQRSESPKVKETPATSFTTEAPNSKPNLSPEATIHESEPTLMATEQITSKEIEPILTQINPTSISSQFLPDNKSNTESETPIEFYQSKPSKAMGHLLNNHVKSLFVLPFQIYPAHLATILDQDYWQEKTPWAGKMPAETVSAFLFNLTLIAFGLNHAWRCNRYAGLVPFVLMMAYYLSNALVRTSGSRYLVPADWVIYSYFFLGLHAILQKIAILSPIAPSKNEIKMDLKKGFWVILSLGLLIGLSLPVLNLSFPSKYHNESNTQVFERLPLDKIEEEIGISPQEIKTFIDKPDHFLLYGRGIYPGYQEADQDFTEKGITFTLITPTLHEILVPYGGVLNEKLPAGEDMIAIGCKNDNDSQVKAYFLYFIQSDQLIWSTTTTFKSICD